jgi:CpeT/CpcT family (DUF1001)
MVEVSFSDTVRGHGRRGARRRVAPAATAVAAATLAVAAAMLCACMGGGGKGGHDKAKEVDLTALLVVLPGTYDNSAQAEADARSGARDPHDAVTLTLTHVTAQRLGHYVYYAQETAADDPRRVLSQKMYSFKFDDKRGIIETVYELAEPLRWRDGQLHKELFNSMMTTDVQAEGCQLFWKKKDNGFEARHDQKACPDPGGDSKPQIEFNGGMLTIGDYKFRKAH